MKKLGIAIIGCGAIYQNHANAVINNEKSYLVCVVDKDENKAKEVAKKYDCDYYVDYKEMLENDDVDVVHICTPHFLHGTMALNAVNKGKHVILEKPVALNYEEAMNMTEKLKESDRIVAVCFQNRYNNTSEKIMEIINNKSLGNVRGVKGYVTWFRDKEYYQGSDWRGSMATEGGGVLINQSIHTLDLLQWFGGKMKSLYGHVSTRLLNGIIEVEDTADATVKFCNDAIGLFYATNDYVTNSPIHMEVLFEKGQLTLMDNKLYLMQDDKMEIVASDIVDANEKSYWGNSHEKLIDNVYECIINNTEDYISVEQASVALHMIKAINYSSKNNNIEYLFN